MHCLTAPEPRQGQDKTLASSRALGSRRGTSPPTGPLLPPPPECLLASARFPLLPQAPLRLTQVPDVRFVAHALGRPLKVQARICHCQLPVAIGIPGDVCGRPLNFLGVPLEEGERAEDQSVWLPRLPIYICSFFFLKEFKHR